MQPSDATSIGVEQSAFSAPDVVAPDVPGKLTASSKLHAVPEAEGAVEQSDASARLASLVAPHRETYSAPEMERVMGGSPPGVLTAAARRVLRQRTVSLPAAVAVERGEQYAALPLPNRSPSLNARHSGGVRAWLSNMLSKPPAEEVGAIDNAHAGLWRSKS